MRRVYLGGGRREISTTTLGKGMLGGKSGGKADTEGKLLGNVVTSAGGTSTGRELKATAGQVEEPLKGEKLPRYPQFDKLRTSRMKR